MSPHRQKNRSLVIRIINMVNGMQIVIGEQRKLYVGAIFSLLVLIVMIYLRLPVGAYIGVVIASTVVLVAETVNTAIEELCDKVQPDYDPMIKKVKDTAAAAVGIALIGAAAVGGLIVFGFIL